MVQWAVQYVRQLSIDPHLLTALSAELTGIPARTACSPTVDQLCNAPAKAQRLHTTPQH
jgi:hypothetical protein